MKLNTRSGSLQIFIMNMNHMRSLLLFAATIDLTLFFFHLIHARVRTLPARNKREQFLSSVFAGKCIHLSLIYYNCLRLLSASNNNNNNHYNENVLNLIKGWRKEKYWKTFNGR